MTTKTKQKIDNRPIIRLGHEKMAIELASIFTHRGMTFATMKTRTPVRVLKKCKETGEINPLNTIWKIREFRVELNGVWENKVNNKAGREGTPKDFKQNKERSSKILSFRNSRVVCYKDKDGERTYYLSYIIKEKLTKDKYFHNGEPIDLLEFERFISKKSEDSKQREADKHGLTIKNDVFIQTVKMENIMELNVFERSYIPLNE